ncbi:MAG: Uma2 family endonuclease [Sandaracinaceae bacterium]
MTEPAPPKKSPPVDDHIVREGARYEVIHGRLIMAPPADEPHGRAHTGLAYVLAAHVTDAYAVALDMLTRTSETNDFAPDASVYPTARSESGGRQLEELAFEIVSQQSMSVSTDKARELTRRGVRRVFCILVRKARVLEWSRETDDWTLMSDDGEIDDRCFARPLPIRTLVDTASTDGAVVAALRARGALRELEDERRAEGRAEGRAGALRDAIRSLAAVLDLDVDEAHLASLDPDALDALRLHLERERRWP